MFTSTQLTCLRALLGSCLWVVSVSGQPAPRSIDYRQQTVAGLETHVIVANLNDPTVKVSVVLAQGFPGTDEPFADMAHRSKAVAAIDGAFFSMDTKNPIGDIVVNGALRHQGMMGTALAITGNNRASFRRVIWGHAADWSNYETVLGCGPTLVRQSQPDLQVQQERFRDPHVLGVAARSAVGLTSANQLLLVSIPEGVSLQTLTGVMQDLGCVEAMNLDGGASTAMYYQGQVVLAPSRPLTNLLVVYRGEARSQHKATFKAGPTSHKQAGTPSQHQEGMSWGQMGLTVLGFSAGLAAVAAASNS